MNGRRMIAFGLLWTALPALGLTVQLASKTTAELMTGHAMDVWWLLDALRLPCVWILIFSDLGSFVAWMFVLWEFQLSEAFPATALTYIVILLGGYLVLHEHIQTAQLIGTLAILAGIALVGRGTRSPS